MTTYIVKQGDNLTKIAAATGTTVDAICIVNPGLKKDFIRLGQKLALPTNELNETAFGDTFTRTTSKNNSTPMNKNIIKPVDTNDQNFKRNIQTVLGIEGGFKKAEKDGSDVRTNNGITQATYDRYLKDKAHDNSQKDYTKKDVKNITDKEVQEIYYNYYYLESGADKIQNKKASLWTFDTAVNCGTKKAKDLYRECGTNNEKWKKERNNYYKKIVENNPLKKKFLKGWLNRTERIFKTEID